ncbi:SixA phosphatase family protein [Afipia birgiae]|jgi:phosphohistidine phosphatase|uniref:SixA phosphatase family protein n=1 Tax=Afipia birgiae TaxID=151414 RepID=UPI0002E6D18E|nr:histidine phosphatase family protein [Afipia birgiae]MBX9819722.1 histidine phosphatase family protein [Afipia birgiae]
MRRLILLRHAKTERDAPSGKDRDRRLDERGRHDGAEIGRWLALQDYRPDLVLVSTATRTQETWDLLRTTMPSARVKHLPELYGADPSELLRAVHGAAKADPQCLMILAHNPGLHELALALVASGDTAGRHGLAGNLPTAGVVVIDFKIDHWDGVRFRGGRLERFASPKLLREWSDDA